MKAIALLSVALLSAAAGRAAAAALNWAADPLPQYRAVAAEAAFEVPAAAAQPLEPVEERKTQQKPASASVKKSEGEAAAASPEQKQLDALDEEAEAALAKWEDAEGPEALKLWGVLQDLDKRYAALEPHFAKDASFHLAWGNLLTNMGEENEDRAAEQWEISRQLDPTDPNPWNNLANYHGHVGPVKKSFEYYAKAVSLDPKEPIYLQNFATTVFLFRKDAQEFYGINEQQVFDKALDLYRQALKLTPQDYALAADLAISYYGIKPARVEAALADWRYAQKLAPSELDKQNVEIHLARWEMKAGRFDKARKHLDAVTAPLLQELKARVARTLAQAEKKPQP